MAANPRIGLLCHNGTSNLGDEASFAATIQNIRKRRPDAEVLGFTINPDDTRERHRIPAFPIRRGKTPPAPRVGQRPEAVRRRSLGSAGGGSGVRNWAKRVRLLRSTVASLRGVTTFVTGSVSEVVFLARSFRALRGLDLLLISGSGQLSDNWGGPWGFPYTIFKWSLLARAAGARLAFVSVGAGPLTTGLGRRFVRLALRLAQYRSFRDDDSKRLVETIGARGPNRVVPDQAHSLQVDPDDANVALSFPAGRRTIVGLNPFPHADPRYWPNGVAAVYDDYVARFATFVAWLLEQGHVVVFFPTQLHSDARVIADIRERVLSHEGAPARDRMIEAPVRSVGDLMSHIGAMDIVVASRFHGIVLSFLMGKPVLAIANQAKMEHLMRDIGQGDYLFRADDFDVPRLARAFAELTDRREQVVRETGRRVAEWQDALDAQYQLIVDGLAGRNGTGARRCGSR